MKTIRLAAVTLCMVTLSTAAAAGWVSGQAPDTVSLLSGKRANIFYAGEPVRFTQKGGPAARYEVCDYYGGLVDRNSAPETITLNVKAPGWYKVYLYGAEAGAESVGGTMFAILRNDPRFPPLPPPEEPSGDPAQDVPTRSILGIGPERRPDPANPPEQRIPRNAQALFNLGAREFTVMFHDGRIEVDPSRPSGLRTPLEDDMVAGFASILSAQTMFPVLSPDEMAGHYQENDVSTAVREGVITRPGGAWDILSKRVSAISKGSRAPIRQSSARSSPTAGSSTPCRT